MVVAGARTEQVVRLRVLGPLAVEYNGVGLPLPKSGLLRGLLGVLIAAEGIPLTVSRLSDVVWGSQVGDTVRPGSVHVAVSRLRTWLAALPIPAATDITVVRDPAGYHLAAASALVDVAEFRQLVSKASEVDDQGQRRHILSTAVGICRGPVLADLSAINREDTLLASIQASVRAAVLGLADASLAAGHPAEGIAALEDLIRQDPLDESLYARLLALLAASGRPAEALKRYHTVRVSLSQELGISPSHELQAQYQAVLAANGPDAQQGRPGLLPPSMPNFVGRSKPMQVLCTLLRRPQKSDAIRSDLAIGAVTGPAGIGKTALAVHAAHVMRPAFPDGQLFVDLHGTGPHPAHPLDVLARFLRALGVDSSSLPTTLEERAELYRNFLAERRILVVLDDAAGESQLRYLLPGAPPCAVLVTSRRRLTGLGRTSIKLDTLSTGSSLSLLEGIVGQDRIRRDPDAGAQLVSMCGRLPLALRIAAGRLGRSPHRSVRWLAERMADDRRRLNELVLDDLEVRASLALSYQGLTDGARRLFRRMGLLEVPDIPAWAAVALVQDAPDKAAAELDELVDAYLIDIDRLDDQQPVRYRLHELVRVFARECAELEEPADDRRSSVLNALAAWHLAADEADRQLHHHFPRTILLPRYSEISQLEPGDLTVGDPVDWFETEQTALVAAVRQAHELCADELCWALASRLDGYFESVGAYQVWADTHTIALESARRSRDYRGEARISFALGELAADRDNYEEALSFFADARHALATLNDPLTEAHVRARTGVAARMLGRMSLARDELEAAKNVFTRLNDWLGVATASHGLGAIHREQGRLVEAIDCYHAALGLFVKLGDTFNEAGVLCSLGIAYRAVGNMTHAASVLKQSLELCRQIGHRPGEIFAQCYLSQLQIDQGEHQAAGELLDSAQSLSEQIEETFGRALSVHVRGQLYSATGTLPAAKASFHDALRLWKAVGAQIWVARSLEAIGQIQIRQGQHDEALKTLTSAFTAYRSLDAPEAEYVLRIRNELANRVANIALTHRPAPPVE